MSSNVLSQREQAEIVDKLISSVHEGEEFDEGLYDQLDVSHQTEVDDAIREYANAAVGSDTSVVNGNQEIGRIKRRTAYYACAFLLAFYCPSVFKEHAKSVVI